MITEVTTSTQIAAVADLAETIWTEHYIPIIGREQVRYMLDTFQSADAITTQITQGSRYFLIVLETIPVGYLGFEKRGSSLFLSKIYLLAAYRCRGYGRNALAFVEGCAADMACDTIELTVNRNNHAAIAAYERLGFDKAGTRVQQIGAGFVMDDYVMQKRLGYSHS